MPLAWLLAAVIWFNASGMSCWKRYVAVLLPLQMSRWRLSYSRWSFWRAELAPLVQALAERLCIKRGFNGLAFVDAMALPVCSIQRERDHKCFAAHASKGHGSLGWFYGFKLHCIVSEEGELLASCCATGFPRARCTTRSPCSTGTSCADCAVAWSETQATACTETGAKRSPRTSS